MMFFKPCCSAVSGISAVVLLIVSLTIQGGCGGKKAKQAVSLGTASETSRMKAGDLVKFNGTLSLRGSTPRPTLVLEVDGGGGVVLIRSGEPGKAPGSESGNVLLRELELLDGMRVSVEGELLPSIEGEVPLIAAIRYELLPLPSGDTPIVGNVLIEQGNCVLETGDGTRYWIRGDFAEVFEDFAGARVWVVGKVGDAALPEKPVNSVPIWVNGYGVLGEK